MVDARAQAVLDFWLGPLDDPQRFPEEKQPLWWKKDSKLDREIARRFGELVELAATGALEHWRRDPHECLAYIVLTDQFTRNMFRDRPHAFGLDDRALAAALAALDQQLDRQVHTAGRVFYRMPLMHAESLEVQNRAVASFKALVEEAPEAMRAKLRSNLDFAERHRDIIVRFGRYPHRNAVLGRASTPEEAAFLEQPGSSF